MDEKLLLEWIKNINDAVYILSRAAPGGIRARAYVEQATVVAKQIIAEIEGETSQ